MLKKSAKAYPVIFRMITANNFTLTIAERHSRGQPVGADRVGSTPGLATTSCYISPIVVTVAALARNQEA